MVLLGPCVCGLSFPKTVPFKRVYTNWIPCLMSSLPLQCLAHSRASEIFLVEIPKGITLAALTSCHLCLRQSALRKTKASNHFGLTNRYIFFPVVCIFSWKNPSPVKSKQLLTSQLVQLYFPLLSTSPPELIHRFNKAQVLLGQIVWERRGTLEITRRL